MTFQQATTIDVQLRRGGAVIDTRDVVANGHISAFHRRPVPDNFTLTVSSSDGSITFVTPSSIVVGLRTLTLEGLDAVLILSVDQPRSVALLRSVREAWERVSSYWPNPEPRTLLSS